MVEKTVITQEKKTYPELVVLLFLENLLSTSGIQSIFAGQFFQDKY
jgi:hypothetical protein